MDPALAYECESCFWALKRGQQVRDKALVVGRTGGVNWVVSMQMMLTRALERILMLDAGPVGDVENTNYSR